MKDRMVRSNPASAFRWAGIVIAATLVALTQGGSVFSDTPRGTSNLPDARGTIAHLRQTIDWNRHFTDEEQIATDSTDVLFLNDNRQIANQVLRLSFDFARAEAAATSSRSRPASDQNQTSEPTKYGSIFRAATAADEEVRQTQTEVETLRQKLQSARGRNRQKLQATVDETQSELDLAQTRSAGFHDLLQFVKQSGTAGAAEDLLEQINELQRSVPELAMDSTKTPETRPNGMASPSAEDQSGTRRPRPSGILNVVEELIAFHHKIHMLDQNAVLTDALEQSLQKLRAPLVANLSERAQRGEELAKQADSSNPTQLENEKHELDALTADVKNASAMNLPLGKQEILLDLYKSNLARWRNTVESQYSEERKRLTLRLVLVGIILGVILGLAEVARRATLRYVHDARRRYQFLLLRRIMLWCAIGITIAFALATEIGSLATFAGLITAGIAVALQNVILAIAGYFFLIGKYGVRVGDRVQIAQITGDVIDIGLIRLHLMELGGTGTDRQPTGRVVVFSNSIVFQPSASFFKQIPGTNFVCHEVSLILAPDSDYGLAEKRMLGAVEAVYTEYREKIERQHRYMERTLSVAVAVPRPQSRLRLTQLGLEVVIRYPIDLDSAAEIDDRITRELLSALGQNPKLKLVGSGIPNIQPVVSEGKAA